MSPARLRARTQDCSAILACDPSVGGVNLSAIYESGPHDIEMAALVVRQFDPATANLTDAYLGSRSWSPGRLGATQGSKLRYATCGDDSVGPGSVTLVHSVPYRVGGRFQLSQMI
jgi:hypothetical protein